ncbi:MAG: histidinol-phosphatase, partial [Verrucomicrobiales bacterium]|nr:histidinol-phosphatase [Verrucomicrobiales bacterium]
MPLPPDYHLHTALCRHAIGEPSDYARRAIELGLAEIGFAEHAPMPTDDFDDWHMRADQLDLYIEAVRKAQKDFPELTVRLGLEMDYIPGIEDWLRELVARARWDYLIGSVHYLDEHWAIDDPKQLALWEKHDVFEVWAEYFDRLTRAAGTGLFDIIGHADLPKKFGFRPDRDCSQLYRRFLEAARKHNCAIEINTAGLRKDCRELYPGEQFLRLACNAGVAIAFGSDAHKPEEVGLDFSMAVRA